MIMLAALCMGACAQPEPEDRIEPSRRADPVEAPAAAPQTQEERTPDGTSPADVHLTLDGEGLRFVTPSGSTHLLPFGAPTEQVAGAIERIWGPPDERIELPDCGHEPPVLVGWARRLSLLSVDGAFVGWSTRGGGGTGAPGTMAGLAVGATRSEVEAAYILEVAQTPAGTEFEVGGIAGVFEDASPDARVTSLWAGRACIFR